MCFKLYDGDGCPHWFESVSDLADWCEVPEEISAVAYYQPVTQVSEYDVINYA